MFLDFFARQTESDFLFLAGDVGFQQLKWHLLLAGFIPVVR